MSEILETFVATAATTKGAGAVHIIKQALQAQGVFVFGELLETASVAELATNPEYTEYKKWHDLLCIFAHGTYKDFKENSQTLPSLGKVELYKLKALTVLTMAADHRVLPYDMLLQSLDISDVRELEDLLIDAITHGLINAKLDQQSRLVEVLDTMGRDLRPDDIDMMMNVLNKWVVDSQKVLDTLKQVEDNAYATLQERANSRKKLNDRIENMKQVVKKELAENDGTGKSILGGSQLFPDPLGEIGFGMGMEDFDEDYRRPTSAGRKKRGFAMERTTGGRTGGTL